MPNATIPVLIAGGGPVGLTLGHVLAKWGVPFVLVERNLHTTRHPKMDLTNPRSMEIFQRLGVAGMLRAAAVPESHDLNIVCATGLGPNARELTRFTYPSPARSRVIARERNDGSYPAEPPMRISQVLLEPILKEALERVPTAQIRYGWALETFRDEGDRVVAMLRNATDGSLEEVTCNYLAGCDGGGSTVRRMAGIELEGDAGLRPSYLVHFRSRELDVLQRWGHAWHTRLQQATLIAQDDRETWTLQYRLQPDGSGFPEDPRDLLREVFGRDIEAEILVANTWRANLLVAERFRQGRILLAGDSAHQVVPTGGYGMNTGIGDALDLGWKLAAVQQGWGGESLLDTYEAERRPVALVNRAASRCHTETRVRMREAWEWKGDLEADSPAGRQERGALAQRLADIGNLENECAGIEYGYRYADSPIVVTEQGDPPAFDPARYTPTTWPGTRLPSIVLPDGVLLYEKLGPGFTLLDFGGSDCSGLEIAAREANVPVTLLPLPDLPQALKRIYERQLVLVRPDHHVAWRGDAHPDWLSTLKIVTGRDAATGHALHPLHDGADEQRARSELLTLERKRCEALVERDFFALEAIVGPDVVHVHANGSVDDHASYMEFVRHKLQFLEVRRGELQVRVHGDAAIMSGRQTIVFRRTGADGEGKRVDAFVVQAWAKRRGHWQQVSFQATPLPAP